MAKDKPGFVRLVVVKHCKLPSLTDFYRRCELFGVPEDTARSRLKEFLAAGSTPASPDFPGRPDAVSNIPIAVPEHFLGREDARRSSGTKDGSR